MGKKSKRLNPEVTTESGSVPLPAPLPPSSSLKRSRDLQDDDHDQDEDDHDKDDATLKNGDAPSESPIDKKKKRRSKKQKRAKTEDDDRAEAIEELVQDAPEPIDVDQVHVAQEESATGPTLDGMSTEERRKAKGKGKAVDVPPQLPTRPPTPDETTRLLKELAHKDSLIKAQSAVLSSLRGAVACNVCLETLDKPYSLSCGHVFCRKCLQTWFHRPDSNPHPGDDDDQGGEDGGEDDDAEGDDESISDGESDSDSDDSDIIIPSPLASSRRSAAQTPRDTIRGTLFGQPFTASSRAGTSGDDLWRTLQSGIVALANGSTSSSSGGGRSSTARGRFQEVGDGTDESERNRVRETRLARFDREPAPTPSVDPPAHAPPSPAPSNSPPPPPPPLPPPAPTGRHRAKNLVCPQCRDNVLFPPFRIFALSDLVAIVRSAERSGLFAGEEFGLASGEDGLDQAVEDQTWGGLWKEGEKVGKRKKEGDVVRDREDGVRRCSECAWEIDEETGECEGCGLHWELSDEDDSEDDDDDEGDDDGPDFLNPLARDRRRVDGVASNRGRHRNRLSSNDERSDEEEDQFDTEDEGFIVDDDIVPLPSRRTGGYIGGMGRYIEDEAESASDTQSGSESENDRGEKGKRRTTAVESGTEAQSSSEMDEKRSRRRHQHRMTIVVDPDEDDDSREAVASGSARSGSGSDSEKSGTGQSGSGEEEREGEQQELESEEESDSDSDVEIVEEVPEVQTRRTRRRIVLSSDDD